MELPAYVKVSKGRCLVDVLVQPGAARDELVGPHGDALKLKVKAPPAGGRANEAVESLMAELLGVPARAVVVVAGKSSRRKRIAVAQVAPEEVARAFARVLSSRAHEPR